MENSSPKFSLNKTDLYKIGRGLLVTLVGTFLAYAAVIVVEIDWTVTIKGVQVSLSPFLIPLFGALIEAGRRWVASNTGK